MKSKIENLINDYLKDETFTVDLTYWAIPVSVGVLILVLCLIYSKMGFKI
jgi:hypothetical protein